MENKLYFTVAKYVPDILRDEKINFGFSYFYPAEKIISFIPSKNINRLLSFDDEMDKDTINMLQADLLYEFTLDSLDNDNDELLLSELIAKGDGSILQYKTKNFVNQIQFSDVLSILVEESLEKTLNDITDIYLYYDRSIQERRMDKERIKSLAKKIIKNSVGNDSFYYNRSNKNLSFSTEPYDFKIFLNNKEKFIKALTFDYKKHNKLYDELKIYLFDLQEALKQYPSIKLEDFIVVINNTHFDTNFEKIAKQVLEEKVNLVTLEELNEVLNLNEELILS